MQTPGHWTEITILLQQVQNMIFKHVQHAGIIAQSFIIGVQPFSLDRLSQQIRGATPWIQPGHITFA
jgi:hypothetical protein